MDLELKKKGSEKRVSIHVYCYWKARNHPREKDTKSLESKIVKFMKSIGWEAVPFFEEVDAGPRLKGKFYQRKPLNE